MLIDEQNKEALSQLRQLNCQIKVLQDHLVNNFLDEQQIDQLRSLISRCNIISSESKKANERRLPHFDFKSAQINPSAILPFSPVTGEYNPIAPNIDVTFNQESKILSATCIMGRLHEGPPGMVHGGIMSAAFDQLLAMCGTCNQLAGPTATLSIDFLKPTPLYTEIQFHCSIIKQENRKIFIEGESVVNGEITCKASGLFIHYQPSKK